MSIDVLMDPITGDLPDFTRIASGLEIIAQRVDCRLRTHRGDWPLDTTKGIDWVAWLMQKPIDVAALAAVIALEVLATPGVTQVQDLTWSRTGEHATITATVLTEFGVLPLTVSPETTTGAPSITMGGILGHSGTVTP